MKVFGIDVSKWQKGFDFKMAKGEGVEFAILKASQADFKDPEFESHYKAAKKEGLLTGAYHYLTATTKEAAKREAEFMIENCLKGKIFEYPIFADVEDAVLRPLDKKTLDEIVKTFCETVEKAGYWAGFYCNHDFYKNRLNGKALAERFSLWLASWTESPLADCQMWQFGGETNLIRSNKIAGVTCDQNYALVDLPSMIRAKGLNGTAPVKAPSAFVPVKKPASAVFAVGDKVTLKENAKIYGTDKNFASWVYASTLYVREINGDRAVVSTLKSGAVTGAVNTSDLKRS